MVGRISHGQRSVVWRRGPGLCRVCRQRWQRSPTASLCVDGRHRAADHCPRSVDRYRVSLHAGQETTWTPTGKANCPTASPGTRRSPRTMASRASTWANMRPRRSSRANLRSRSSPRTACIRPTAVTPYIKMPCGRSCALRKGGGQVRPACRATPCPSRSVPLPWSVPSASPTILQGSTTDGRWVSRALSIASFTCWNVIGPALRFGCDSKAARPDTSTPSAPIRATTNSPSTAGRGSRKPISIPTA